MFEFPDDNIDYGSQCMGKEAIIFFQHTCFTVQWGKCFRDFCRLILQILQASFYYSSAKIDIVIVLHTNPCPNSLELEIFIGHF